MSPESHAISLVSDDAYTFAEEEGYIRWLSATDVDPGCWSNDLDVDLENFRHDPLDDVYYGNVKVFYGSREILRREYSFWFVGGYMRCQWEDE